MLSSDLVGCLKQPSIEQDCPTAALLAPGGGQGDVDGLDGAGAAVQFPDAQRGRGKRKGRTKRLRDTRRMYLHGLRRDRDAQVPASATNPVLADVALKMSLSPVVSNDGAVVLGFDLIQSQR